MHENDKEFSRGGIRELSFNVFYSRQFNLPEGEFTMNRQIFALCVALVCAASHDGFSQDRRPSSTVSSPVKLLPPVALNTTPIRLAAHTPRFAESQPVATRRPVYRIATSRTETIHSRNHFQRPARQAERPVLHGVMMIERSGRMIR